MTSYDYGSVMHYERNAFAINYSAPTIIPTQNSTAFIGQRIRLSPVDILEIQRYYNCVATPNNVRTTTRTTTTTSTTSRTTISTATTVTTVTTAQWNAAGRSAFPILAPLSAVCLMIFDDLHARLLWQIVL